MSKELKLSSLRKTWIFDLDGTLVKHNGYKIDGFDTLLNGVSEFFKGLSSDDFIIILTARNIEYKEMTETFLGKNSIRFDKIIYDIPMGERILINDKKPSGLLMTHAFSPKRDEGINFKYVIDKDL